MSEVKNQDLNVVEEVKRNWIGTGLAGLLSVAFTAIGVLFWALDWKSFYGVGFHYTNFEFDELISIKYENGKNYYYYACSNVLFWGSRFAFFIAAIILVAACAWKPLVVKYNKAAAIILSIFNAFLILLAFGIYNNVSDANVILQMAAAKAKATAPNLDSMTPLIISIVLFILTFIACIGLIHQRKYRILGFFAPFIIIPHKVENEASA